MRQARALFVVSARLLFLAGACARLALASGAPPAPAVIPGVSAPAASGTLAERFARPEQTIEYHFMIQAAGLSEAALDSSYQAAVAGPLKVVADVGALGRCAPGIYLDSKERDLRRHNLIVRVRPGQVTIKARAASPAALLDLVGCTSRKYELDRFGTPEYSISSDIAIGAGELDPGSPALTPAKVWECIERNCPGAWRQIRPVLRSSGRVEIPGVAHLYGAKATLRHPAAAKVTSAGVSVWFFPPTDRFLVELSFTGLVKDRAILEQMSAELGATLRTAGLLRADQSSKTRQYFAAYFGPGTQRTRKPRRPSTVPQAVSR
jgi:hypothetical protein